MKTAIITILVLCIILISGCANRGSLKFYKPEISTDNFIVSIKSDAYDDVEVIAYIRKVYDNCATEYLGKVELGDGVTKISLPFNQRSFVTVVLYKSSVFGDSSISYGSFITSRYRYHHEFYIEYIDGLYDSEMYEVNNSTAEKRDVMTIPFEACQIMKN